MGNFDKDFSNRGVRPGSDPPIKREFTVNDELVVGSLVNYSGIRGAWRHEVCIYCQCTGGQREV